MNSRILTLARLEQLGACNAARVDFQRVFGPQVEVTPERLAQPDVIEANFDFDWAVDVLLPPDKRDAFYDELKKRRTALKEEKGYSWASQISREERNKLAAVLFAEFYVAYGLDEAVPTPIAPCEEVTPLDEEELEEDDDEREEREFKESGKDGFAEETSNGN